MARHYKAFTYKPKIKAVRDGRCTQTIRPRGKRPVKAGDTIVFHGWEGRPYWSKWSWRKEVTVTRVEGILINVNGIVFAEEQIKQGKTILDTMLWTDSRIDELARKDGIQPPRGTALGELFTSTYTFEPLCREFQIITWKIEEEET